MSLKYLELQLDGENCEVEQVKKERLLQVWVKKDNTV